MSLRPHILCLAALFLVAPAHAQRHEMMDGDFSCGFGAEETWIGLNFHSSGDLFPKGKFGWRIFEAGAGSAEAFCRERLETLGGMIPDSDCTVAATETTAYDDGAVTHRFAFVCHGPRRDLVRLGARLLGNFLAVAP